MNKIISAKNIEMSDNTDILLKTLVEGQNELNSKMGELISIEAARQERESVQKVKNERYETFIKQNEHPLYRVRRMQIILDSTLTKAFGAIVLAAAIWLGNNLIK